MREIRLYGSEGGEFSPRPLSNISDAGTLRWGSALPRPNLRITEQCLAPP